MAAANRELMRAINRFAILHAIRNKGTISRTDISKTTGLSQATVTSITGELLKEDMLIEQQNGKSIGGRRPVPLSLNPNGAYTVGVHLAINQITVVLMDLQASIIHSGTKSLDINELDAESVIETLVEAVQACLWDADFSKNQISGVGIAIPGLVDSRKGYVRYIPNYHLTNIRLAEIIEKELSVPAYIENSANAMAIFEQWFGKGRGVDNFFLITMENGIGMGMVVNGQLFRGSRGIAGEFGHTIVDENGPVCRCGKQGCLESICGNNAIIRDAIHAAKNGDWTPGDADDITLEEIIAEANQGNPALQEIYRRAGHTLGTGISNLQSILDSERIIISGKGVLAGELLFEPMREKLDKDISFGDDAPTKLYATEWKRTNYARGAGALVLQEVYESPANRIVPII